MVSFVHPGKNSLVSFGSGVFCPTFVSDEGAGRLAAGVGVGVGREQCFVGVAAGVAGLAG